MNLAAFDFLRPPSSPRIGWILLGVGAVVLGAAVWLETQWAAERGEVLRLRQFNLAKQQTRPKPAPPSAPTLVERHWQQARLELRRPWLPVLRAIEVATTDPVYLLSLTVEPVTGLVKLDAEAPSFDVALLYVQQLSEGGALERVILTSHAEAVPQRADRPIVKFSVATHWNVR